MLSQRQNSSFGLSGVGTAPKANLSTPQGLYQLAANSGLQKDADRIMEAQSGEETNKIFSGGFISDIFDSLNALQYGVTGMLKGKSFMEGVKTRQSFSDKDALGDNGLPGVIAGIVADIAVDPLTYVAPWTIAKKIPAIMKIGKAVKTGIFGKLAPKAIKTAAGVKTAQLTEGGTRVGRYLGDKLVWMFGQDPVFKDMVQRSTASIGFGTENIISITKQLAKIPKIKASTLLKTDETGRIARKSLDEIKGITTEPLAKGVTKYKSADEFMKKTSVEDLIKLETDGIIKSKGVIEFKGGGSIRFNETKNEIIISGIRGGIERPTTGEATRAVKALALKAEVEGKTLIAKATHIQEAGKSSGSGKYWHDFLGFKPKGDNSILTPQMIRTQKTKGLFNIQGKKFESQLTDIYNKATKGVTKGKSVLSKEELSVVSKAWKSIDDLEQQAVKSGLLGEESKIDGYIKNAYDEYEKAQNKGLFKTAKRGIKGIKSRKAGLTPEKMAELGQIDNPSYLFFKSTLDILKDVENAKLFSAVSKTFATDIAQAGFKQLPKKATLGRLSGKYVPEQMLEHIQDIAEPIKHTMGKKLMADFKFMKVIMNPATHARNILSNQTLNWWKLGMNPADPRVWKTNATALREIAAKGGKWMDEAKGLGYNLDTFAVNELKHLFDLPEARATLGKFGKGWNTMKSKLGNIYQGEENFAKLSAYIFNRTTKGLAKENAWKMAEAATFNYAQVTPFIRKMRTSLFGFPFITFTTKATPLVVETALKYPRRISVLGKIKTAVENQADLQELQRERASEPPWVKDGFFVKLPMKDKNGRSAYFDLTYIIPFGDLVSGQFFERKISAKTGIPEAAPLAAMAQSPAINLLKEIGHNQDFYGNQIWKESGSTDNQLGDLFRHIMKTYLPPLVADQIPGGYNAKGEQQQRGFVGAAKTPEEEIRQKRTLTQEILRNVGLKVQPINADIQESYQTWNQKKALETLLKEKGVLNTFQRSYIPK